MGNKQNKNHKQSENHEQSENHKQNKNHEQSENHEQKRELTLAYACKVGDINLAQQAVIHGAIDYGEGFKSVCRYGHANLLPLILECYAINKEKNERDIVIATCYGHLDVLKYIYSINSTYITDANGICNFATLCNRKNILEWLVSLPKIYICFDNCFICADILNIKLLNDRYVIKNGQCYIPSDLYGEIKDTIVFKEKPDIAYLLLKHKPNLDVSNVSDKLLCALFNMSVKINASIQTINKLTTFRKYRQAALKYSLISYEIPDFDEKNLISIILDYVMYEPK